MVVLMAAQGMGCRLVPMTMRVQMGRASFVQGNVDKDPVTPKAIEQLNTEGHEQQADQELERRR